MKEKEQAIGFLYENAHGDYYGCCAKPHNGENLKIWETFIALLHGSNGPKYSPGILSLNESIAIEGSRLFGCIQNAFIPWPSFREIKSGDSKNPPKSVFDRTAPSPIGSSWYTSEISCW